MNAVVSRDVWAQARLNLLTKEKELTRRHDELAQERLQLPWVKVEATYSFDGPNGRQTLADLFDGRDQLIVYHFMFGPEWKEGCVGCSFVSESIDAARLHLEPHGVSVAVMSRAPYTMIESFQKRMGWRFHWVSAHQSVFNYDYAATTADGKEVSGASCFFKDAAGNIFHTYSTYARGCESLISTYQFLDIAPLGRNEHGPGHPMSWVKHHDRYTVSACGSQ